MRSLFPIDTFCIEFLSYRFGVVLLLFLESEVFSRHFAILLLGLHIPSALHSTHFHANQTISPASKASSSLPVVQTSSSPSFHFPLLLLPFLLSSFFLSSFFDGEDVDLESSGECGEGELDPRANECECGAHAGKERTCGGGGSTNAVCDGSSSEEGAGRGD